MPAAFAVENVANHCGEQAIAQEGKASRVGEGHREVESITCRAAQGLAFVWARAMRGLKLAGNQRILGVSEFVPLHEP